MLMVKSSCVEGDTLTFTTSTHTHTNSCRRLSHPPQSSTRHHTLLKGNLLALLLPRTPTFADGDAPTSSRTTPRTCGETIIRSHFSKDTGSHSPLAESKDTHRRKQNAPPHRKPHITPLSRDTHHSPRIEHSLSRREDRVQPLQEEVPPCRSVPNFTINMNREPK